MHGVAAQLRCILWKLGPFFDRFVEIKALVVDNKALVTMFCGRNSPCFHHLWTLEYVYLEIRVCILEIRVCILEIRVCILEIRVYVSGNLGMCFWKFGYVFLEIRVWLSGYSGTDFWIFCRAADRPGRGGAAARSGPGSGWGRSGQVRAGPGRSGPVGELERT